MHQKRLFSLFLCFALCLTLTAPALAASQAPDGGAEEPWYAEAQTYVNEMGLMTGAFKPDKPVTKAVLIQTLYNREGRLNASKQPSSWFADAMAWAIENELSEAFDEETPITRAEGKDLLDSYCAWKGADSTGLMVGNENGELELEESLTRAQLAQILLRLERLAPRCAEEIVDIEVTEQEGIPAHVVPGTLCTPAVTEGRKFPAVVMLHSTSGSRDESSKSYQLAAALMAQRGIVSLRIDFMGFGDSKASTTDYNFTSANLDAKAAADYLAGLDCVDGDKIAVLGWSQGGTNALLAAAKYPETFRAVITWAGALNLRILFSNFEASYEAAKRGHGTWGERWFREVKETDILTTIQGMKSPVLAINGSRDSLVPKHSAAAIASVVEDGTLLILEGVTHSFHVNSSDRGPLFEIVNAGIDFLQEKLNVSDDAQPASATQASTQG